MPLKTKLILGTLALGVLVMLVIFGHEPSASAPRETCTSRGIDSEVRKEGTCYVGKRKQVVVNPGDVVRLESLDARLVGMRENAALSGPEGTKVAKGIFVTFDLAITNRTEIPQSVGENQLIVAYPSYYGEDVEAEQVYEPASFLAQKKEIPSERTVRGSVTFDLSVVAAERLVKEGNLDIGNFRTGGDYEPERLLEEPEVGVIRTYRKPTG
jgi:hypothetical protein